MRSLALFNNKGGVGKTSLLYHLAWMFSQQGRKVLAVDLDPQANLTAMFLTEEKLENLPDNATIYSAIKPVMSGSGDIKKPKMLSYGDHLALIPGDLRLSLVEDGLSDAWSRSLDGQERPFRDFSALYRTILVCGERHQADIILVDVGPNLGALNRTALIGCDHIITPLAPDLYSLQGLRNLGPTVRRWRKEWKQRLQENSLRDIALPRGTMNALGYIVTQHSERVNRPTKAFHRWIEKIPSTFHTEVLNDGKDDILLVDDPYCLAQLKHYRSLMPLAMEARKPIFDLTSADGAFGSHAEGVRKCRDDFDRLAKRIWQAILDQEEKEN